MKVPAELTGRDFRHLIPYGCFCMALSVFLAVVHGSAWWLLLGPAGWAFSPSIYLSFVIADCRFK
jgi:hypothetical protein